MEYVLKLVELFLLCLAITYLGAWAFVAARGKWPAQSATGSDQSTRSTE